ncbi:MAG: isocitrate lyase/PEP mutase family protein [Alphaproteobacteria bacterium]|nr:isocitrate lyase/PEP mutase family protein [Alphaproteobacteria bacterium]MDP6830821.1 isocitrate lyase/PEP mutase family protein [Alphaproteobacteria bacterium]MDP6872669.1 isocitrate lyase/PEP mutase family protein [Alphaproteobacteria bacterium]
MSHSNGAAGMLRRQLAADDIIVAPGCFNAMGARMIERVGFNTIYVSGYGISVNHVGRPDVGLATLTEMTDVAGKIASAVNIPVICDADTGYGNAINVMRTVEEFIKSGVSGIHLEDQVAPKRCGHVAGKQVISLEEAAGKIRAAARVRDDTDPDFVLIARCDARGVAGGSLDDAISRCQAYAEAGADVVFPEGLLSAEEIGAVCDAVPGGVLYNRTGVSPNISSEGLQELGVDIVINPGGAMRAAANAMWDYYAAFAEEDEALEDRLKAANQAHPLADFHSFAGFGEIREMEAEFLPEEEAAKYEGAVGFQP